MRASALLVMDVQQHIVDRYPGNGVLDRVARAVVAARAAEVPVIFVRVAFRPGLPEVSPRNKAFGRIAGESAAAFTEGSPATQIHPALSPRVEESVVLKKRVSAFAGSDLEIVLRARGTTHLVLAGIATSGVVLSTLREAADRDYQITVLADACADADEEVHRVLTGKVFPRQAEVTTVEEWEASLP